MTQIGQGSGGNEEEVLSAFRGYFDAFMKGSIDELASHVGLPFFDIRSGEMTHLTSGPQLEGFRRGLRARMATQGIVGSKLKAARVLMNQDGLALLQFQNIRQDAQSLSRGGTHSLAFMRRDAYASWRVWMIAVLRTYENGGVKT